MFTFKSVAMAPRDPILGLNEQFTASKDRHKVNLAVGVYFDGNGKLPLLECVKRAEQSLLEPPAARGYLPIDGILAYDVAVKGLVFGESSEPIRSGRVATVQSLGGTGALKIGADFLRHLDPSATVLISDPSWENHKALFTRAGYQVDSYPYYDEDGLGVDFPGMLAELDSARAGTVVVLHACCHNPTGYDLTGEQWDRVVDVVRSRELVAFLDMAYQGFAHGLKEDGLIVEKFVEAGLSFLVATSFSKNLSLYGERVGALSVLCANQEEAARVLSQLKIVVRTNYSSPPIHGGAIVAAVLADSDLRMLWESELGEMRQRIKTMRSKLADGLRASGVQTDVSFITRQIGMFSYSGLSKAHMERLRQDHGIFGTDTGRICVAALNDSNIEYVCKSIAEVVQSSTNL